MGWELQMKQHGSSLRRQTRAFLKEIIESGHKVNDDFKELYFTFALDSIKMAYDEIESELNWERLSNAIETTPNGDSHTFDDISLKRPSEHEPNGSPKRQKEMTGSIDTSQFDSSGKKPSEGEWEHDTEDSAKRQRVATTSNGPKTQNGTEIPVDSPAALKPVQYGCFYCTFSGNAAWKVYDHWHSSHTGHNATATPFGFVPIETVRCFYCSATGTYKNLIDHSKRTHSNRIPILTEQNNSRNCGICHHTSDNLAEHFRTKHRTGAGLIDPIWLTNQRLDQLLRVDVHGTESDTTDARETTAAAKQLHIICGCCQSVVEGHGFPAHIQNHSCDFKCLVCSHPIDNFYGMALHEAISHSIDTLSARCAEYSTLLQKQFLNTKIVFDNGLILSNRNLHGTRYDNMINFGAFVEELIKKKKKMFREHLLEESDLKKQNELLNNLCICNVPCRVNEDLMQLLLKIAKLLGVPLTMNDVAHVNRGHGGAIIAQLNSSDLKDLMVKVASTRQLYLQDLLDCVEQGGTRLFYVNHHLTFAYRRLWDYANGMIKNGTIHSVALTKKGLMVKRTEYSNDAIYVTSEEQLYDLLK